MNAPVIDKIDNNYNIKNDRPRGHQLLYTLPKIPFKISEITEISKSEIKES